jgi:protease PrsW
MYCAKCGTECQPEFKFCKSCGAPVGANGSSPSATVTTPQLTPQVAPNVRAAAPNQAPQAQAPSAPPPGMVPVLYQAYPGGPQQVYYVPAQSVQAHSRAGFLESLQSRIRELASTDKLEGFSLGQTFSETFKRHGADAVEEYMMVGSARTTPAIDVVETGWPKPWMFFRLLAFFLVAFVVLDIVWNYTGNTPMVPAIMIIGAFAVPLATLVLLFEMNTPRNVSLVLIGKLFLMGGLAALCAVSFEYMFSIAGKVPGIVEETAKLAAVLLVVRGTRYKYELNGILFGAAVGAGFASFETSFYGLINAFLPTLIQSLQQGAQQGPAFSAAMQAMVGNLAVRGVLAPFGHVAWTAIAAGAFWRLKRDQPTSASMLLDTRFLKAFAIPVAMHTIWDASVIFPNLNTVVNVSLWIGTGLTTWYVLFGLIQQGLRQVKDMQQAQLENTLAHVEAAILPQGAAAMQPQ